MTPLHPALQSEDLQNVIEGWWLKMLLISELNEFSQIVYHTTQIYLFVRRGRNLIRMIYSRIQSLYSLCYVGLHIKVKVKG